MNRSKLFLLLPYEKKMLLYYKFAIFCNKKGIPLVGLLLRNKIIRNYGCYISLKAKIHDTVIFPHPTGIVIGDGVEIAENTMIYQNVTLGSARFGEGAENKYPRVGPNCIIYSGAKIVGNIDIGKNSIIAANAVVTCDVPDNSTAGGVPAKLISSREKK